MHLFRHNEQFMYFVLRLPTPRPGEVLGLVGTNGIGKSTALKILAGKQKPNLGRFTVSNCPGLVNIFKFKTLCTLHQVTEMRFLGCV